MATSSKLQKLYDVIESGKTILCVGPMSTNCIDAAIEVSNENDIPMILIPSRRQVESNELGGGYVMSTEDFVPYVRERDKKNLILIERDHGGPLQGNNENILPHYDSFEEAKLSYKRDIESGFDILEIDPSLTNKGNLPLEDDRNYILDDFFFLYAHCEGRGGNKDLVYEFEFEEHSERKTSIKDFMSAAGYVVNIKKDVNDNIKFLVGNIGLYVREMENVGKVDFGLLESFITKCKLCGLYFKAHNCDYIDEETLTKMNKAGVAAINIAPQYGVEETKEFCNQLILNGMHEELNTFVDAAFFSNKWKKWMKDSNSVAPQFSKGEELGHEKMDYKAKICGHYVFNHPEIIEIRKRADKLFGLNSVLKNRLKLLMRLQLISLGWTC